MRKTSLPLIDPTALTDLKAHSAGRRNLISEGFYTLLGNNELKVIVSENIEATSQAKADKISEAQLLRACNHTNIMHVYGMVEELDRNVVDIVTEYCDGGTLDKHLDDVQASDIYTRHKVVPELLIIALDVASACQYLHGRYLHPKTLAANSILLKLGKRGENKAMLFKIGEPSSLVDLISHELNDDQLARYASPELHKPKHKQTASTDIWSFGVLLWQLFNLGGIPYSDYTYNEAVNMIVQGEKLKRPNKCVPIIGDLMESCWKSPIWRPGLSTVIPQIIKGYHSWADLEIPNIPGHKITDISDKPFLCGGKTHVYEAKYYSRLGDGLTESVAIKISLNNTVELKMQLINEANQIRQCNHNNILHVYGLIEGFENDCIGIVMELCDGTTLLNMLNVIKSQFTTPTVRLRELLSISVDILSASIYLDKRDLVHRFLAPRAVLLKKHENTFSWTGIIHKIGDPHTKPEKHLLKDYTRWVAPEIFEGEIQNSKSDVWSFGVTLWQMLTLGNNPYGEIQTDYQVLEYIDAGKRLNKIKDCPPMLDTLMKKCWKRKQVDRPTFHKLHHEIHKLATEIGAFKPQKPDKAPRKIYVSNNEPVSQDYKMQPVAFLPAGAVAPTIPMTLPAPQNNWGLIGWPAQDGMRQQRSFCAQTLPQDSPLLMPEYIQTDGIEKPSVCDKRTYMASDIWEQATQIDCQADPQPQRDPINCSKARRSNADPYANIKIQEPIPSVWRYAMNDIQVMNDTWYKAGQIYGIMDESKDSNTTMDFMSVYNSPDRYSDTLLPGIVSSEFVDSHEQIAVPAKAKKVVPHKLFS